MGHYRQRTITPNRDRSFQTTDTLDDMFSTPHFPTCVDPRPVSLKRPTRAVGPHSLELMPLCDMA